MVVLPVKVLNGVSHWMLDEQPDRTADLLLDWIAARPATSGSVRRGVL
jgi:hypothetical protein